MSKRKGMFLSKIKSISFPEFNHRYHTSLIPGVPRRVYTTYISETTYTTSYDEFKENILTDMPLPVIQEVTNNFVIFVYVYIFGFFSRF